MTKTQKNKTTKKTKLYTYCPRCKKKINSSSINRHASHCNMRLGKKRQTTTELDSVLATAAPIFTREADQFAEDDMGTIATNEYVGHDSNSEGGEGTQALVDGNGCVPRNILVSKYRKDWMTFLRDEESDQDEDDEEGDEEGEDGESQMEEDQEAGDLAPNDHELGDSLTAMATLNQQVDLNLNEGGLLNSVEYQFRNITDRNRYVPELDWTWQQPPLEGLPLGSKLRNILSGKDGETMGLCYKVATVAQPPLQLSDEELSMVHLIDFCEMNPINGRRFLDGLLDLVAEEMRLRNFNPAKHPRRETVSKKVMEMYGNGCEPVVAQLTVSSEETNIVLLEETVQDGQ